MDNSKQLLKSNAIWLVFILEVIIFAVASKGAFVSGGNIINISRQVSYYGIASIGMTFVILIAGIDLSIGSIITLVNVICAFMMVNMGLNIATFSTQTIFEGVAYLISGGRPISGLPAAFSIFGRDTIGPVPICAIIMILCFALGSFILNKTFFGRYFYAIGGNEEAAELSGIRVNRMKTLIYSLSGLFAGLAGIVLLSRSNSAQSTVGKGMEFDVITCVVLGGVSVNGGVGRMSGVVAGVLIIGCLTNGMILMDVSEYIQMVVKGIVLAVAVGIDCMSKKRQAT